MKTFQRIFALLLATALVYPVLSEAQTLEWHQTHERFSKTPSVEKQRNIGKGHRTTNYVFDYRYETPVEATSKDDSGNQWTVKIYYLNRAGTEAIATWLKNGSPADPKEVKKHLPTMWEIFRVENPSSHSLY